MSQTQAPPARAFPMTIQVSKKKTDPAVDRANPVAGQEMIFGSGTVVLHASVDRLSERGLFFMESRQDAHATR